MCASFANCEYENSLVLGLITFGGSMSGGMSEHTDVFYRHGQTV